MREVEPSEERLLEIEKDEGARGLGVTLL